MPTAGSLTAATHRLINPHEECCRIRDICHSDKICEVLTVLTRGASMSMSVRGAPIVLGEAARVFVSKMANPATVERLIPESGSTIVDQIANGTHVSSGIAFS